MLTARALDQFQALQEHIKLGRREHALTISDDLLQLQLSAFQRAITLQLQASLYQELNQPESALPAWRECLACGFNSRASFAILELLLLPSLKIDQHKQVLDVMNLLILNRQGIYLLYFLLYVLQQYPLNQQRFELIHFIDSNDALRLASNPSLCSAWGRLRLLSLGR